MSAHAQIGAQQVALDRRKYGPLLLCLPPEPLAVITLHVVLSALLAGGRGAPAAGVAEFDAGREAGSTKVMPLVLQVGRVRAAPQGCLRLPAVECSLLIFLALQLGERHHGRTCARLGACACVMLARACGWAAMLLCSFPNMPRAGPWSPIKSALSMQAAVRVAKHSVQVMISVKMTEMPHWAFVTAGKYADAHPVSDWLAARRGLSGRPGVAQAVQNQVNLDNMRQTAAAANRRGKAVRHPCLPFQVPACAQGPAGPARSALLGLRTSHSKSLHMHSRCDPYDRALHSPAVFWDHPHKGSHASHAAQQKR